MKGRIEALATPWRTLQVYLPPCEGPYRLLVVHAGADFAATLGEALQGWEGAIGRTYAPFAVAFGAVQDWNLDLSPWPAPALQRQAAPFPGGGAAYLQGLCRVALPALQAAYPLVGQPAMAGYSMGGLAALWGATRAPGFGAVASLSGSLWYDGFPDYLLANPLPQGTRVYLSLGRAEEKTRNARLRAVGDATRTIHAHLQQKGYDSTLLWHDGTHFTQIPQRWKTALQTLFAL